MKIGIEAQRIFRKKKHGMDIVALELIKQLQLIDTKNEYFIFVNNIEDLSALPKTSNFNIIKVKTSPYPLWEQFYLPKAVKDTGVEILHCTSNTSPISLNIPLILTLHDIIYLEKWNFTQGTSYQIAGNLYRRWNVPIAVKLAKHILTVSDFEKNRIINHFGLDTSRVSTVYNGVGNHFNIVTDIEALLRVKNLYNLPDNFIFFLGNTDPKKNVIGVLKALAILKQKGQLKSKLLMLDINRDYLNNLFKQINDFTLIDDIVFCGYVPNSDLPAIYSQANLFLYPSLRESFGIPLLEAMACGIPIITSNTSSMPEVAENAAVYVNPFDANEIANAIIELQSNQIHQKELISIGKTRVEKFTWRDNAIQTIDIYNKFA
ncbi:MAG: glycosyltransferase family 4 protein [Bacteroidia bacterium]|jgi:glycosyltransferase involved in cell wall biosynthesis|nr:glycosyltransferase family 4 protein [Bacteroidia bacterium]